MEKEVLVRRMNENELHFGSTRAIVTFLREASASKRHSPLICNVNSSSFILRKEIFYVLPSL